MIWPKPRTDASNWPQSGKSAPTALAKAGSAVAASSPAEQWTKSMSNFRTNRSERGMPGRRSVKTRAHQKRCSEMTFPSIRLANHALAWLETEPVACRNKSRATRTTYTGNTASGYYMVRAPRHLGDTVYIDCWV